jgi:HEPN superfamily Swt1-like protein
VLYARWPMDSALIVRMIPGLLQDLTKPLAGFLRAVLPELSANWWEELVLDRFHSDQRERIRQRRISDLEALDFAALAQVFDNNWRDISTLRGFLPDQRDYIKQARTIRRRYSHITSQGVPSETIDHDLGGLWHFALIIDAPNVLCERVASTKASLHPKKKSATKPAGATREQQIHDFLCGQKGKGFCGPCIAHNLPRESSRQKANASEQWIGQLAKELAGKTEMVFSRSGQCSQCGQSRKVFVFLGPEP